MIRKKLTQTGALGLPNGVVVGVVVGPSLGNTDLVATLLESLGIIINPRWPVPIVCKIKYSPSIYLP